MSSVDLARDHVILNTGMSEGLNSEDDLKNIHAQDLEISRSTGATFSQHARSKACKNRQQAKRSPSPWGKYDMERLKISKLAHLLGHGQRRASPWHLSFHDLASQKRATLQKYAGKSNPFCKRPN
jgi:hypothetical protein